MKTYFHQQQVCNHNGETKPNLKQLEVKTGLEFE